MIIEVVAHRHRGRPALPRHLRQEGIAPLASQFLEAAAGGAPPAHQLAGRRRALMQRQAETFCLLPHHRPLRGA